MHANQTLTPKGQPPRWTPPAPFPLPADTGVFLRDRNAARYPLHPLEPAIKAVLSAAPRIRSTSAIDIVACGSTLGNLLRFAMDEDVRFFRMVAEAVDGTVFLTRRERSPTAAIDGVHGFGHTFPEHYTTWDSAVKGSASHERVLQYAFGGYTFLVRSEADAYIPSDNSNLNPSPAGSAIDLLASLANTSITPRETPTTTGTKDNTPLTITPAGTLIPQPQILDIKTRSIHKKHKEPTLANELPRLWVRQIPHFLLAYHEQRHLYRDDRPRRARGRGALGGRAHAAAATASGADSAHRRVCRGSRGEQV